VEGVQPAALDKPNGEPDDLTLITGIGPRIQTILNDYGIWHFSQIAEWTDDNEIWIDRQLNFAGRVSREGWINQARELTSVNSDS
jgi:predicted flap endonuclease-1-like 5' DNA nuclease